MKTKAPDLNRIYPRSPNELLGGYAHLSRMIDKARAKAADTLGEYIYPCPLDQSLLDFLGIQSAAFLEVAQDRDDEGILKWVKENGRPHSGSEIEWWNRELFSRKPQTEDSLRRFQETRSRVAPQRQDVTTWVDLLDLEEKREVPSRA